MNVNQGKRALIVGSVNRASSEIIDFETMTNVTCNIQPLSNSRYGTIGLYINEHPSICDGYGLTVCQSLIGDEWQNNALTLGMGAYATGIKFPGLGTWVISDETINTMILHDNLTISAGPDSPHASSKCIIKLNATSVMMTGGGSDQLATYIFDWKKPEDEWRKMQDMNLGRCHHSYGLYKGKFPVGCWRIINQDNGMVQHYG